MKTFKTLLTAISVALAIYLGVIFTIDPEAVSIFEVLFILVSAIILLAAGVVIDVFDKKRRIKKMSKKRKKRMSNSEKGRLISMGKKARKIEALEQQLVVLDKEIQNKESEAFTVSMRIKDAEKEIEHLSNSFQKTISEIEALRKELKETAEKWREEQK